MNNTPETDAQIFDACDGQGCEAVLASFARKLERERDEAQEQLHAAVGLLSTHPQFEDKHPEKVLKFVKEAAK